MIDTHTHLYMEEFTADDPEGGAGAGPRFGGGCAPYGVSGS